MGHPTHPRRSARFPVVCVVAALACAAAPAAGAGGAKPADRPARPGPGAGAAGGAADEANGLRMLDPDVLRLNAEWTKFCDLYDSLGEINARPTDEQRTKLVDPARDWFEPLTNYAEGKGRTVPKATLVKKGRDKLDARKAELDKFLGADKAAKMKAAMDANPLLRARVFGETLEAAVQLMGQEHPDVKHGGDAVGVGLGHDMEHLRARWDAI